MKNIKTILVVIAMPEEMERLNKELHYQEEEFIGNFKYQKVNFQDKKIITAASGIGKANAAACTALGIYAFKPELVINIGVAAGIHQDLSIGDIAVATALNYHDADATTFGYQHGQIPRMPVHYQADNNLTEYLVQQQQHFPFKIIPGLISSGDSFIADANLVIELKTKFPDMIALDMESCAIAQACHQLEIPFCCIRGITDAANEKAKSYREALELAVENITSLFFDLLKK